MNTLLDQSLSRVRYTFTCEATPELAAQVRRVSVREALSQPYEIDLELFCELPDLDPDALLATSCQLSVERDGTMRMICGVVARVELHDHLEDRYPIQLTIVPALRLLEQRLDTRLWQDMTAVEVIEEVLTAGFADYQRELDLDRLGKTYAKREYIVQYAETDLDFVSRLLEDEGISYDFDHDRDSEREVMVLHDSADHWTEVPTLDDSGTLAVINTSEDLADLESIQRLTWSRALRPTALVRRSFDWLTPTTPGSAETEAPEPAGPTRELYHHGRIVEADPTPRVVRELAHARAGARVLRGTSNVVGLVPGRRFRIDAPERPELHDHEFLLTRVLTRGDCPDVELGPSDGSQDFTNEFECERLDGAAWQPPLRAPIPKIHGPQTAIVTGPEGEEIHTDEHGRVKVRFDWDRQHELTDDSSMWIRVAHGWAGAGFGALFIPRVGMEVVVEFIAGAPDRPLVTGCVYNGASAPNIALPDSKTQSTIRTCSSPGGGGFNELRFEDAAGSEEIFIHAQRDLREKVGRNSSSTVGANRTETIHANHRQTVDGEQTLTVHNGRTLTIHHGDTVAVSGVRHTTIEGPDNLIVRNEVSRFLHGGSNRQITGIDHTSVRPSKEEPAAVELHCKGTIGYQADQVIDLHQGPENLGVAQAKLNLAGGNVTSTAENSWQATGNTVNVSGTELLQLGVPDLPEATSSITLSGLCVTIDAKTIILRSGSTTIQVSESGIALDGAEIKIDAGKVAVNSIGPINLKGLPTTVF